MMVQKIWNFRGLLVTSYLSPNTYSISTNSEECHQKILEELSWHFMSKLLNVKEWDPSLSMDEIDITMAMFWV